MIKELSSPLPGVEDISFPTKYAQPLWAQCMACSWKQHRSYWRNPLYNVVRFIFTTVCGLVFGSIFWKLGHSRYELHYRIFLLLSWLESQNRCFVLDKKIPSFFQIGFSFEFMMCVFNNSPLRNLKHLSITSTIVIHPLVKV